MIAKASIDDIKDRALLQDVVAKFCPDLSDTGSKRSATCPFCNEPKKKKKFIVTVPKQLYYCFNCKNGGANALGFLMDEKRPGALPFMEAIKWLGDFYGMELRKEPKPGKGTTTAGGADRAYFDQVMAEIGYRHDRPEDKGLFRPAADGGIEIRFPRLEFVQGESPWQQHDGVDFVRTRLHPTKEKPDQKYSQPANSGVRIFIPPPVVELYRQKQGVPTLYVVEGEKKAWVLANAGLPIVGITGYQMFHAAKGEKVLHPDLKALLTTLRCVNAVLVHDADAKQVKWDPNKDPEKDLGARLKDFAAAVNTWRMLVLGQSQVTSVYYAHVHERWLSGEEKGKGIDDLAAAKGDGTVKEALEKLKSGELFSFSNLTDKSDRAIKGEFLLNLHGGVPKAFFDAWSTLVTDRPFRFLGSTYEYYADDEGASQLRMVAHKDSKLFIVVAGEPYKKLTKPNEHGHHVPYLKKWPAVDISRNYLKKGVGNFYDTLQHFDDFVVEPGHFDDYKEVVKNDDVRLYNKYYPLDHPLKPGPWTNIEGAFKHWFGEHEVKSIDPDGNEVAKSPNYIVAIDRLALKMRRPRLKVPALVLESSERNTGKSTYLDLMRSLWQANSTIIPNEALSDVFNSDWSDKMQVGLDEATYKNKGELQRLKTIVTSPGGTKRGMYAEREMTPNFLMLDITTNDGKTFLEIADDEFRFWVNTVPELKRRDPEKLDKMMAEVPAFAHYLYKEHVVVHPRLSRLWFAESLLNTEARKELVKNSVSAPEMDLRLWLEKEFYYYRWPELCFTVHEIADGVNKNGTKHPTGLLSKVLRISMKDRVRESMDRVQRPLPYQKRMEQPVGGKRTVLNTEKEKQRWYVFRAIDFLSKEDAWEIYNEAVGEWSMSLDAVSMVTGRDEPLELLIPWPKEEPVEQ